MEQPRAGLAAPQATELRAAWEQICAELSRRAQGRPFWEGRLSDSALAGATAVVALSLAARAFPGRGLSPRVDRGASWLLEHRGQDGAWGDTPESMSNPTATLLVLAALRGAGRDLDDPDLAPAAAWLEAAGGLSGVLASYGEDRTFAAPIVALAASVGLARWEECPKLPFALAALPRWTFSRIGLPVVSYALPALIAVGLARFAKAPPAGRLARWAGLLARQPTLATLARIVPEGGGFLEAVPLTSFVLLSLLSAGLEKHPAVESGIGFLERTQRPDGAWPVDSNLSVWVAWPRRRWVGVERPPASGCSRASAGSGTPSRVLPRAVGPGPICRAGCRMPTIRPAPFWPSLSCRAGRRPCLRSAPALAGS